MTKPRTPQDKKALDYELQRVDHRGGRVNNNKSSRKAWPLLKARRSRQYRQAVRRVLDDERKTDEHDATVLRTVPVRQRREWNWGKGDRLGDWLVRRRRNRVHRVLQTMLAAEYASDRDRARYAALIAEAMSSARPVTTAFAEAIEYILAGPWPRGYVGHREGPLHRASSEPDDWYPLTIDPHYKSQLVAFFDDAPDWHARVRTWLSEISKG